MFSIHRTDAADINFCQLVNALDAELAERDGEEHEFYSKYNVIKDIEHVAVAYADEVAVACGALKKTEEGAEIKRMFVAHSFRRQGLAQLVLKELESWAQSLDAKKCFLETGKRQPEAIQLYTKAGYEKIPNYGQYKGVENSVCFEKLI